MTLTGAACSHGAVLASLLFPSRGSRSQAARLWSDVLLDGAMHNSPQDNLHLPFPFPDALQEFSVATSALSAQVRHARDSRRHCGDEGGTIVSLETCSSSSAIGGSMPQIASHR